MAHRTGFTAETLGAALIGAGFAAAMVHAIRGAATALAFRSRPAEEEMANAQAQMLPSRIDPR